MGRSIELANYGSFVFDCDGVVLNSNHVKTNAFKVATLPYGKEASDSFISYHKQNGGVSRLIKFQYFLEKILKVNRKDEFDQIINNLLNVYSQKVWQGLMECSITPGLNELRHFTSNLPWFIISGGDQDELRKLFLQRNISHLFNGGIFGSPDDKNAILTKQISQGNLPFPSLFIGDSKLDHLSAKKNGLDFVFVRAWTDFNDYHQYCKINKIPIIDKIEDLMSST